MEASSSTYVLEDSVQRIKDILAAEDAVYEEKDSIPPRSTLTFDNGFYVNCSAVFVDMRGSSKLAEKYRRPTLAKVYRAYISELIAILKDDSNVNEVNIEGDCIWGVYDTPFTPNIDSAFSRTYHAASLIDILNWRLEKESIDPVSIGVGMAYGRALMIKAGHKGSAINDIVWMGSAVGEAAKLCSYGNRSYSDKEIMVSDTIYSNLKEDNQKLLERNNARGCYHGNIIATDMNSWLDEQRKNSS